MKIYTLWEDPGDPKDMPWIVAAIDEYSLEEAGTPEEYVKASERKSVRELIIDIPEEEVRKLFRSPEVKGKVDG